MEPLYSRLYTNTSPRDRLGCYLGTIPTHTSRMWHRFRRQPRSPPDSLHVCSAPDGDPAGFLEASTDGPTTYLRHMSAPQRDVLIEQANEAAAAHEEAVSSVAVKSLHLQLAQAKRELPPAAAPKVFRLTEP